MEWAQVRQHTLTSGVQLSSKYNNKPIYFNKHFDVSSFVTTFIHWWSEEGRWPMVYPTRIRRISDRSSQGSTQGIERCNEMSKRTSSDTPWAESNWNANDRFRGFENLSSTYHQMSWTTTMHTFEHSFYFQTKRTAHSICNKGWHSHSGSRDEWSFRTA